VNEWRWSMSNHDIYTAWKTWYSLLVYTPPSKPYNLLITWPL
jgi:hypothetical protein